jgi:hypothetical protein
MLSRFRGVVRSLGWADALLYLVARTLQRLSFGRVRLVKYHFVAQPVQREPAADRPGGPMRIYVAEQAVAVPAGSPRSPEVIEARFAQHARCIVAEREGEFAGFIWLCPQLYREDEVRCTYRWSPSEAAAWDFDVLVAPRFRMGRLFSRLWGRAHLLLRSEGVAWTLSRIDAFNGGSLTAHRKLGAQELGCGWFLVIGPLQLALFCVTSWRFAASLRRAPELCFDLSGLAPRPPAAGSSGAA